jgi:hypothetical protein
MIFTPISALLVDKERNANDYGKGYCDYVQPKTKAKSYQSNNNTKKHAE